ncbi:hypothetical protein IAT38_005838 [Cryptococcus sp. DSM 104549]
MAPLNTAPTSTHPSSVATLIQQADFGDNYLWTSSLTAPSPDEIRIRTSVYRRTGPNAWAPVVRDDAPLLRDPSQTTVDGPDVLTYGATLNWEQDDTHLPTLLSQVYPNNCLTFEPTLNVEENGNTPDLMVQKFAEATEAYASDYRFSIDILGVNASLVQNELQAAERGEPPESGNSGATVASLQRSLAAMTQEEAALRQMKDGTMDFINKSWDKIKSAQNGAMQAEREALADGVARIVGPDDEHAMSVYRRWQDGAVSYHNSVINDTEADVKHTIMDLSQAVAPTGNNEYVATMLQTIKGLRDLASDFELEGGLAMDDVCASMAEGSGRFSLDLEFVPRDVDEVLSMMRKRKETGSYVD